MDRETDNGQWTYLWTDGQTMDTSETDNGHLSYRQWTDGYLVRQTMVTRESDNGDRETDNGQTWSDNGQTRQTMDRETIVRLWTIDLDRQWDRETDNGTER